MRSECLVAYKLVVLLTYVAKAYYSLRLLDKIEEISHNNAIIECTSEEDSY